MTELDTLISDAYQAGGSQDKVNKVYAALFRSTLYLPIEKQLKAPEEGEEPFKPLVLVYENNYFISVFDTAERLREWAGNEISKMDFVSISGKDLVAGLGDNVFLCLNVGFEFYKEFSPEEVRQLKKIASRIDQLKG